MTKKAVVFIVALTLVMSLFTGCKDSLIERLEKVQAHITITAKLPDELKTGDFDPDDFSYILKWYLTADPSKVDQDEFPYDENLAVVYKFDPGEYTFELSAIVGGVLKAHGKNTIAIDRGQRDKLEIPLTYYIYGEDKGGFTVGEGVITLSGKLELAGNETISIPSGMRLVIEEGCTIDVGAGKTLTFDGVVETLGDLVVKGNLALTKDAELHAQGGLSVDGTFNTVQGAAVVVDDKLAVTGTMDIGGHVKVGSLPDPSAGVTEFAADVKAGGVLEVSALHPQYTGVTVDGGGTLRVVEDTTLDTIVLKASSTLEGVGVLKSGTLSGEGNVKGGRIDVDTIATVAGKSLALEGPVAVTHVTGDGTLKVDGTVTADELTIEGTATLEATGLAAKGDTVTIDGSGSLLVKGDTDLRGKAIVLADDSKLEVDGELASGSLSGKGSITADDIQADEIVLESGELLTLNGETTTGKISGNGSLDAQSIVGSDGKLVIEGKPVVAGNLSLQPDTTISFADGNASLTVKGDVKAWGPLSLEGGGSLAAQGDITVAGDLERGNVNVVAVGAIKENEIPLGQKPHLEVYVPIGKTLVLGDIDDGWETVTVLGGGTFIVNSVTADTVYEITLERGSTLEITGDLSLADRIDKAGDAVGAIINFSRDSTLTVSGDVKAAGDLAVSGDGDFDITEKVDVAGDFTIDETAVTAGSLSMAQDKTLNITNRGSLTLTGTEPSSVGNVVLADGATMDVAGALTSTNISGEGAITADSISVDTIKTDAGKALTLDGDVAVTNVAGNGTATVTGTVIAGNLFIAPSAILEASGLIIEEVGGKKTLTITGGGTLKINGNVDLSDVHIVLEDGSTLEIDGTLTSNTISGSGTISATSIDVDTITTVKEQSLTLVGDVTPGSIAGDGSLAVTGVVSGAITISGTPSVTGNLSLGSNTTVSIPDGKTLTVTGSVTAADDLTVSGTGTFEITKDLTVAKELAIDGTTLDVKETLKSGTISGDGSLKANSFDVDTIKTVKDKPLTLDSTAAVTVANVTGDGTATVTGTVTVENLTIGEDATLVAANLAAKKNTVTIGGGGTLQVNTNTTVDNIVLVSDSTLKINGTLTSGTISGDGTVEATSIVVGTIGTVAGGTLAFTGDVDDDTGLPENTSVTAIAVTGSGTATVVGTVSAGELSIASGATLEASNLIVVNDDDEKKTLTITGGGTFIVKAVGSELDAITLENGSYLNVSGPTLEIKNDAVLNLSENATITLSDGATLEVDGALNTKKISGDGTVAAGSIDVDTIETAADRTLTLDSTNPITVTAVTGDGTATVAGTVSAGALSIADGATLEASNLTVGSKALTITDGGTFIVKAVESTLDAITLENGSYLNVTGPTLEHVGDAVLNLNENATITLGSDAKLEIDGALKTKAISGDGAVAADSIDVVTIDTKDGKILTLEGDATVAGVTGSGTVKVNGTVTAGNLSIATGTTLEAFDLAVVGDILKLTDGGTLKVDSVTNDKDIELKGGTTLDVTGTLKSGTISGDGTITADGIDVGTIETVAGGELILDSDVTTGKISGSGSLDAPKIVGAKGDLVIEDSPTVTGNLTLEADTTLSIEDGAKLTVNGEVKAWGDLTLEGNGELDAKKNITVEGDFEYTENNVSVTGTIYENTPPLGDGDDLVLFIKAGEEYTIPTCKWKTVTVSGGGTLIIENFADSLELSAITLENGSNLQVKVDLPLADKSELNLGRDSTLNVSDDVNAARDLTVSGNGEFVITGTLKGNTISGEGSLKANSFDLATIDTGVDKTLTLEGGVTVASVIGSGTAKVNGTVTAGDLSIAGGATLEASGLSVVGDTLTLTDGGTLKVNGNVDLSDVHIVLEDGSTLEINGTLTGGTISGEGTVKADSIVVATIMTEDGKPLTLDGDVTPGSIAGDGSLAVTGVVSGDITISGTPSVTGNLSLGSNTTVSIPDGKTLTVTGSVTAADDLTLSGNGKLDITETLKSGTISGDGNVKAESIDVTTIKTAEGKTLKLEGPVTVEEVTGTGTAKVTGTVTAGDLSIASGATLEASGLTVVGDTLTLTDGGTLKVNSVTNDKDIELKGGTTLDVTGTLKSGTISGDGSLKAGSIDITTIDTGDGKTLTLEGPVTVKKVEGTGKAAVTGTVTAGDLSIASGATLEASDLTVVGDTLTLTDGGTLKVNSVTNDKDIELKGGTTLDVTGILKSGTISGDGSLKAGSIDITTIDTGDGKTLTLEGPVTVKKVEGTGTAKVEGSVTTGDLTIESGATLDIEGALNGKVGVDGKTEIKVSGGGELTAGTVVSAKLSTEGNQTITADTFDVKVLAPQDDATLTLSGDVATEAVTGKGSVIVEGTVTAGNLSIATGTTLEAFDLAVVGDTLKLTDGGTLKVDSVTNDKDIELKGGTTLDVTGTLKSGTISGDGTITADGIDVGTIETVAGGELILDSDVTTGKISGSGSLDAPKIVGAKGDLVIEDSPTVTGNLTLEADTTLSIEDGAKLTVNGEVKAWGDLTLEGNGELDAKKNITVEGDFEYTENNVSVTGTIYENTPPLGDGDDLNLFIKPNEEYTIPNGKWTTITVSGGGTLEIEKMQTGLVLESITLERESTLDITGNSLLERDAKLHLKDDATISLSTGSLLKIDGSIIGEGDLTFSGTGTVEAKKDLTVARDFITESDVIVKDTLDVKGDATIDGEVTVGSLVMATDKTLEITKGGSLEVGYTGTTKVDDVDLSGGSLTVDGTLKSKTISGEGTITAAAIDVSTIDTTALKELILKSTAAVTVTTVTGDGTATIEGTAQVKDLSIANGATLAADSLAVDGDTLKITGGGTLVDKGKSETDLSLLKVELAGGSTLAIDNTKTLTSDTISGEGTISAKSIEVTTIATTAGKTTTLEGDVTISEKVEGGGTVEVDGQLKEKDANTSLTICVAKGTTLKVKSLDPAITSLTVTCGGTLKITDATTPTTLYKIVLTAGSTLEIAGSLTGNETTTIDLSGSGTLVVNGTLTTAGLSVPADVTLDVSKGTLDIQGEVLNIEGTLQLGTGGWEVQGLDSDGIIVSGDGDIKKGTTSLKWYTLHNGAKAQYFKQDGVVQIRFLPRIVDEYVTPRIAGIAPTEPIVRVGEGAVFVVPYKKELAGGKFETINKLDLKAKQLILEAGSKTIIDESWWNAGTTFVFGNGGSVTAEAEAIVTYSVDNTSRTWIGDGTEEGKTSGEWNLTDDVQMKYDGTITTVSGKGQLEINDWKTNDNKIRALTHTMVIENEAEVKINMKPFTVGTKGKMLIENGGSVEIPNGKELKTTVENGLVIKGTLTVNDGGTVNIKDSHFVFDEAKKAETGIVYLNNGSIYRILGGDVYFGPAGAPKRNSLSFNTENVNIVITPAWYSGVVIKKYIVTAVDEKGTFEVNRSSTFNLVNHYMTIGKGATLTFASGSTSEFSIGSGPNAKNVTKVVVTIAKDGTFEIPSGKKVRLVGYASEAFVEAGGFLKNKGTISIEDGRRWYLEVGANTCGKKPSGLSGPGVWGSTTCPD